MLHVRHYLTATGVDVVDRWLRGIRDPISRRRILERLNRLELGNFGDHRFCREGVWELRIDAGPGFRVYYARFGECVLLLLAGGDKRTQDSDIERAIEHLKDEEKRR